jgi:hypothetical protein
VSCAAASSLLKLSEEWYLGKAQGQCINIYIYICIFASILCCVVKGMISGSEFNSSEYTQQ